MKTKNKPAPKADTSVVLTHSPFAKLKDDGRLRHVAVATAASAPPPRPPVQPKSPPCKIRMRLETAGRNGKAVTRVTGLPLENLETIALRLRAGLGCGASLDGADLLLQGSLVERATAWLDRAGDLRALQIEKVQAPARQASPAPDLPTQGNASRGDATRRSDIRKGQRVAIVQKADQLTGKTTDGTVKELLTNSEIHPRGIKVRLDTGEVGRVKAIYD